MEMKNYHQNWLQTADNFLSTDILLSVFIAKAHFCYGESGNHLWKWKDA